VLFLATDALQQKQKNGFDHYGSLTFNRTAGRLKYEQAIYFV